MDYISVTELDERRKAGENVFVLDIREPYELDICKIEAHHIPMAEVGARIDEIPSEKDVVVLCRSGKRALAVANMLEVEHKRDNLRILEGGILAWIDQIDNQLEAY